MAIYLSSITFIVEPEDHSATIYCMDPVIVSCIIMYRIIKYNHGLSGSFTVCLYRDHTSMFVSLFACRTREADDAHGISSQKENRWWPGNIENYEQEN